MRKTKKNTKFSRKKRSQRNKNKKYIGGSQEDIGFIITRCVKNDKQNILWQDCCTAIKRLHPGIKIIIIDDNSDKSVLKETPMDNVEIIQSEFPGAGEFLPYYYLLTRQLFKKAVIMQDSMILTTRPIPYENVEDFMFLYENQDGPADESAWAYLMGATKVPKEMGALIKSGKWRTCWGTCMVVTYDFLKEAEEKVGFMQWKTMVKDRNQRMDLERAMALVCCYLRPNKTTFSLFGSWEQIQTVKIHGNRCYTLERYLQDKEGIKNGTIS